MSNSNLDLTTMSKEELIHLIVAYDKYIIDYPEDHEMTGNYPVCLEEFYECEYSEAKT